MSIYDRFIVDCSSPQLQRFPVFGQAECHYHLGRYHSGSRYFYYRLALVQPGNLARIVESNDLGLGDAVGNSIALTLWSFLGLESAAVNMDAVENPKKSVPIATFVSTISVAVIYVASTNVIAGIVPNAEILASSAPFGLAFSYMLGDTAGKVVMGLMVFSCAGSLLSWQFTLARVFKTSANVACSPRFLQKLPVLTFPSRACSAS